MDYLMILEDDAVFVSDTVESFCETLIPALISGKTRTVYVDLAGGLPYDYLRISALESRREGDMVFFSKPVGNTSCSYLVDKQMVWDMLTALVAKPRLRFITADWLIQAFFIFMRKCTRICACINFHPTIFEHCTLTGKYSSSISDGGVAVSAFSSGPSLEA